MRGRVGPRSSLFRAGVTLSALAAGVGTSLGDVTDPVGYYTYEIPSGERRLIAPRLVPSPRIRLSVAWVEGRRVGFIQSISSELVESLTNGSVRVRDGQFEGVSMSVSQIDSDELEVAHPIQNTIQVGDLIDVFAPITVDAVEASWDENTFLAGQDETDGDLLSVWDPEVQEPRTFYLRAGHGWREVGDAEGQDASDVPLPYPPAIWITRRGEGTLKVLFVGAVPMPNYQSYVWVRNGRNLLGGPLVSEAANVTSWNLFRDGEWASVLGGSSAPLADTFRYTNDIGGRSNWFYYRPDGKLVDLGGEAGDIPMTFAPALELVRSGEDGFVRLEGFLIPEFLQSPDDELEVQYKEAKLIGVDLEGDGMRVQWESDGGGTYRVQRRDSEQEAWENWSEAVVADGSQSEALCSFSKQGQIRIIRLP